MSVIRFFAIAAVLRAALLIAHTEGAVSWNDAMGQPAAWYGSAEAVRIADNLLLYQFDNGGWDKNIDMAAPLGEEQREQLIAAKSDPSEHTTIDNSATYTQIQYLAKVYHATGEQRFADAFLRGIHYLLEAQYPNGGWPQYYPLREGYYGRITYNDGAMVGAMETLRMAARGEGGYEVVPEVDRERAREAVELGVACILKSQVIVDGERTVWCAQHDEKTLQPAPARTYELISLSGSESVGITRFLMSIDQPSPEIVRAVEGAIAWFSAVKIDGLRYGTVPAPEMTEGIDRLATPDPDAPPLWARFYEIGTNRPMFSGRDGVKKYSVAEIEWERRTGYQWYGTWPARLLEVEYPTWKEKWAPDADVR